MKKTLGKKNGCELTRQTNRKKIRANRREACGHGDTGRARERPSTSFPLPRPHEVAPGPPQPPSTRPNRTSQGGKMSAFYKKHKITNGKPYNVKIVP